MFASLAVKFGVFEPLKDTLITSEVGLGYNSNEVPSANVSMPVPIIEIVCVIVSEPQPLPTVNVTVNVPSSV